MLLALTNTEVPLQWATQGGFVRQVHVRKISSSHCASQLVSSALEGGKAAVPSCPLGLGLSLCPAEPQHVTSAEVFCSVP